MRYSFRKVLLMMGRHKRLYLLLILELAVGMCMYVYSSNLSASIREAEEGLEGEEPGHLLRITGKMGQEEAGQAPLSLKDYEYIQSVTGGRAELSVKFSDVMLLDGEAKEYHLLLLDGGSCRRVGASAAGASAMEVSGSEVTATPTMDAPGSEASAAEDIALDDSSLYAGERVQAALGAEDIIFGIESISAEKDWAAARDGEGNRIILQAGGEERHTFQVKPMPEALRSGALSFLTVDSAVALADCMLMPLPWLDTVQAAVLPEIGDYELRIHGDGLPGGERILEEIAGRLNKEHGEFYFYEFYSPKEELNANTYKTKWDINAISKIGILLLCTVFLAAVSIFRLLLERREQQLGICQACGAGMRVIALEIFEEILLVCLAGTVTGSGAGIFLTYHLTSYLAGGVKMTLHLSSLLHSLLICMAIVIAVFGATARKIYTKSIIALIREQA